MDLTHEENIKETRETIIPIEDTLKLCASKYILLRAQKDSARNDPEVAKSDITNSRYLVEIL